MIGLEGITWLVVLCYSFLYISIVFLWLPNKLKIPVWGITFAFSCLFALMSNQIEYYAVLLIMVMTYALYYYEKKKGPLIGRRIAGIVVLLLSYGLGAHVTPYFHNLKVLSNVYISSDGIPFTLYLNFDKTLVGLLILGLTHPLLVNRDEWMKMLKDSIPRIVKLISILVFLALLAGEVYFDPKLPECLPIWIITNLLFVCIAEEGFFRGFIQKNLAVMFQSFTWGNWLAIVITSLIFGFAHYAGGIAYSIWGTIAGLGYGWIYQKSNQIEASILAHFSLNAIHFLFFTYPALAKSV